MTERADIISGTQERAESTALGDVIESGLTYNNGAGTDLALNNIQSVLVPAGTRTVAPPIATQSNLNHRGVLLFLNVTASPANAAASLTPRLQAIEPVTGTVVVALLTGVPIVASGTPNSAVGLYTYAYYPGLPNPAAALGGITLAQNGLLPRVWTATVTPTTGDAWGYSLAYALSL